MIQMTSSRKMPAYGISLFPHGQLRTVPRPETTALTGRALGPGLSLYRIQSLTRLLQLRLNYRLLLLDPIDRWSDLARLVPNAARFHLATRAFTLIIA